MKEFSKKIIDYLSYIERLSKVKVMQDAEDASELIEKDDYIKWLEKFTKKFPYFIDEGIKAFPYCISKSDIAKIELLKQFYIDIEKYAKAKHIYPTIDEKEVYYSILYNNKIYDIGLLLAKKTSFFCCVSDVLNGKKYICFEDLANPPDDVILDSIVIERQLERIEYFLDDLLEKGIPYQAIACKVISLLDNDIN